MSVNYFNHLITSRREARAVRRARMMSRRLIRDASNPFEVPDTEFQKIFRYNKPMVLYLCEELRVSLQPHSIDGLPVHIKVLTCLRHLGNGSYQRPTGQDHILCIAQTTVSKYLSQFTDAVNSVLLPKWINFPATEAERQNLSQKFERKFGVPNILGAIDCTHVAIFPPSGVQGIQYKNRKGFHSINTQLICDVDCRIIHINARYPGRVHDQFIFNNSNMKSELTRLYNARIGSYFLLGDSGYALEPWMMTPVLNAPQDSPSDLYTQWHCKVRNSIERTNGYLKGSFRSLGHDRVLHYGPEKSSSIIYTCATLYNIMLHYRVPLETIEPTEMISFDGIQATRQESTATLLRAGQERRQSIINSYFT